MYADVVVSLTSKSVDKTFVYAVPERLAGAVFVGSRVGVAFGKRVLEGYVVGISQTPDENVGADKIKEIDDVKDPFPLLTEKTIELARFMRDKYYTTMADCIGVIVPPAVEKLKRERKTKPEAAETDKPVSAPITLTAEQESALSFIRRSLSERPETPVLLRGVTGSGKTEVYSRVIDDVLAAGRQAIVLVPEIALTPQLARSFEARFGGDVAVTHHKLSMSEKAQVWKRARNGGVKVVIGPRSAVFAPFPALGLIVIDEEHEKSYKSEVSPKYDAREVAVKRAEIEGCGVIMCSATPSVESYYRAVDPSCGREPRYALTEMNARVNGKTPRAVVVDMRKELAAGNRSIFSEALAGGVESALSAGEQVILFMNRRGHSTFVSCRACGLTLTCSRCSVNYTYHMYNNEMLCHYCGERARVPDVCPQCGSKHIRYFGVGTQKVEEEVSKYFPEARVLRMDADITSVKGGHEKIIRQFERKEADILVGTQMVAKGHNFPSVSVVGVVAADAAINIGDFNSAETAYQLITQVSGRAGRADTEGVVYIQTYNPDHYSIRFSSESDYPVFYRHEISIRRQMGYPPFTHIFGVLFTGKDERAVIAALNELARVMTAYNRKKLFRVLGPAPAAVSKINGSYRWKILVVGEDEDIIKQFVFYCVRKLEERAEGAMSGVKATLTLNPAMIW